MSSRLPMIAICVAWTAACGGGDDDQRQPTESTLSVKLTSSDLIQSARLVHPLTQACMLSIEGMPVFGQCLTPHAVRVKGSSLRVGSSFGNDNGGARVIGFSAAPEGAGLEGPFGMLGLASFDLADPAAARNPHSEDNFQDPAQMLYFNRGSIGLGALEVQIEIPEENAGIADRFWTIRYPFIDHDLAAMQTSSGQTFAQCAASDSFVLDKLATERMYPAPAGFIRGDILVCQKATPDAVCADSDFAWIDSTDGSLATVRPAAPVRLTGEHVLSSSQCKTSETWVELDFGGIQLQTSLTSAFTMTKSLQTNPDGPPHFNYTYQGDCVAMSADAGMCNGPAQSGKYVEFDIDFELENFMFLADTADVDLATSTAAEVRVKLEELVPKPVYVANRKSVPGVGDDSGTTAALSVTLSEAEPAE